MYISSVRPVVFVPSCPSHRRGRPLSVRTVVVVRPLSVRPVASRRRRRRPLSVRPPRYPSRRRRASSVPFSVCPVVVVRSLSVRHVVRLIITYITLRSIRRQPTIIKCLHTNPPHTNRRYATRLHTTRLHCQSTTYHCRHTDRYIPQSVVGPCPNRVYFPVGN